MSETAIDATNESRLETAALAILSLSVFVATVNILGWTFEYAPLRNLFFPNVKMKFNNVLCWLLISSAFLLSHRRFFFKSLRFNLIRIFVSRLLGASAFVLAAMTLLQIVFEVRLGVDELFMKDVQSVPTDTPGRMSPNSASAYLFLAVACFLVDSKKKLGRAFFHVFSLSGLFVAALALIGYLYQVDVLYQVPTLGRISNVTATAIFSAALSGLFLRPQWGFVQVFTSPFFGGYIARRFTLATVVLVPALGWLSMRAEKLGYFNDKDGIAFLIVGLLGVFVFMIVHSARFLNELDRKKLEQAEVIQIVNRVGLYISAELDLEKVVQAVTDAATELSHAKFGAFFYNSQREDGQVLTLYTLSGASREAFAKFPNPRHTDLFKITFQGEGVVRSDDIRKDPRYGSFSPHFGMPKGHLSVVSYLAVPVISRSGQILGALLFGHPEPGVFTQREQDLVVGLAAQAAVAMDNASLYQASQQASVAKTAFVTNMSHEIRTPLGAILGFSELLADSSINLDERANYASVIKRNGKQLTALIDDLLDLSRVELHKIEIEKHMVNIPQLMSDLSTVFSQVSAAKNVVLTFEVSSDFPREIETDLTRLKQILSNLIANAIKFTEKGWVKVVVSFNAELGQLKFAVSDSGIGLAVHHQEKIFQPFVQADSSIRRKFGGTGLGLALSKKLADALGGELKLIQSELGKGSSFELVLPIESLEKTRLVRSLQVVENSSKVAEVIESRRLNGAHILLVDDAQDNQLLLKRILEKEGANVECASQGQEGVEMASKDFFDIILMDIQMPVLDGISATRELRSRGFQRPIVALTAHAMKEERERSIESGCDDHLTKPVNRVQLLETIEKLVKPEAKS